ncbi:hypothetical protein [Paraliomyxa miuraensis]|uniref:hypothetical protein n=1 Tax=Paraliomyxa miuraensis TaxID=376150 RepID=UPI002250131A|nr:hypothetical protein [Paraliomyxa miuraensis]MCX4240392.1 hypothetical protein [Paraliomyxa miuraensis]
MKDRAHWLGLALAGSLLLPGCGNKPAEPPKGAEKGKDAKSPDAKTPDAKSPDAKTPDAKTPDTNTPDGAGDPAALAFRNAATDPPPDWKGPTFALSKDYPAEPPAPCAKEVCTWLGIDVDFGSPDAPAKWTEGKWADYIEAIKAYAAQGQDPQLANEVGIRVEVDGQTRWYHVPWMAYDPKVGRDFVHGTTNERTASFEDLMGGAAGSAVHDELLEGKCQDEWKTGFETWAVGVYNEYGGYAVGQAIPASGIPQAAEYEGRKVAAGTPMAEGTAVVKYLFTDAPPDCVPFLQGSPEWQVDRHVRTDAGQYLCERKVQTVRLLQVDVAVVDARSPTRWVYGTFSYDGNQKGDTVWERLVPVGVMWGSDPTSFPAVPKEASKPIHETVLNPGMDIYEHYGCTALPDDPDELAGHRLNGPVDNPVSACMACHGAAFAPGEIGATLQDGVNVPTPWGSADLCNATDPAASAAYFANYPFPQPYPGGKFDAALPLDTSLQLQVAYGQYGQWKTAGAPVSCTDPS